MKAERYKQLMESIGMKGSISLMLILEQVANEVEQEVKEDCCDIVKYDDTTCLWRIYFHLVDVCREEPNSDQMKQFERLIYKLQRHVST